MAGRRALLLHLAALYPDSTSRLDRFPPVDAVGANQPLTDRTCNPPQLLSEPGHAGASLAGLLLCPQRAAAFSPSLFGSVSPGSLRKTKDGSQLRT